MTRSPDSPLGPADGLDVDTLASTMRFTAGTVTRDELLRMIACSADACAQISRGDVVLAAENRAGTVAVWLAAMLAGRRVLLVNPELPVDAFERLHDPELVGLAVGGADWVGRFRGATRASHLSLDEVEQEQRRADGIGPTLRFSGSTILATSGTTGASKLVEWPWCALNHAAVNMAMVGRYDPSDVVVTSLPLFHANALLVVLLGGMVAGSIVAIDRKFSARGFSRSMRAFGGTKTSLLGSMARLILETDEGDYAPVRRMIVAPCDATTASALSERYGASVAQIYGQTDIGIVLWNDDVCARDGSCGEPLPGWEAEIAGDPETGGELLVRSVLPGICALGYVGDDALTRTSRRDFWFHTGDLFAREDGRYRFTGRAKDVIRTRGENVSCGEVEAVLRSVRGVTDAAVLGRPNRLGEDDVIAVVETADLHAVVPELVDACRRQLPPHARPTGVAAMTPLPRTTTEKIAKQVIDLDRLEILALDEAVP